jgi:hypothetical protein
MLGAVVAAQFDLEAVIAELARAGGSTAMAQSQVQALAQLQRHIGTASLGDLAAMRGTIDAAVAQAQAVAQQARTAASGADGGEALADLADRAQTQGAAFMRDLRQYDHLLQFDDTEELEAYRQREEERRKRYDAEAAKGTPEGTLNANGAALGQMADLAVHGGSADPVLMRRMDELAASTAALRAKIMQEGGDVSKFDEGLRTDLRAIMHSKGVPDDRIDALLAAHRDNPLEAMKAFVVEPGTLLTERDVDALNVKLIEHKDDAIAPATLDDARQQTESPETVRFADAASEMAKLISSGVVAPSPVATDTSGHGVTAMVNAPTSRTNGVA